MTVRERLIEAARIQMVQARRNLKLIQVGATGPRRRELIAIHTIRVMTAEAVYETLKAGGQFEVYN